MPPQYMHAQIAHPVLQKAKMNLGANENVLKSKFTQTMPEAIQ